MAVAPGRVHVLLRSPRVAPGLMSGDAWAALRGAGAVLAEAGAAADAVRAAGVSVTDVSGASPGERARALVEQAATGGDAVWLGSDDGDPGLTDALAAEVSRLAVTGASPQVEIVTASHDVPGSRLLDLVAVMDRLRSPGGCPWDAEQTHASLRRYLLEETYELLEALDRGDRTAMQEELGDVALQVVFHARLAAEDPDGPFDIDDVAAGIVAKLVRRHPHVFGDADAADADEVERNWESLKDAEKAGRGRFEGIPTAAPALLRAQDMLAAAARGVPQDNDPLAGSPLADFPDTGEGRVAAALVNAVRLAAQEGVDAEATLSSLLTRWADTVAP